MHSLHAIDGPMQEMHRKDEVGVAEGHDMQDLHEARTG
jgi:hypothetical protein